jgi:sn1-specific diacylglycerol lipase
MEVKIVVASPLRVITFLHGKIVLIIINRFCECFVPQNDDTMLTTAVLVDIGRCHSVHQVRTTILLLLVIQIAEMAVAGVVVLFVFSNGIRKLLERRSRRMEYVTSLRRCFACLGCLTCDRGARNVSSDGLAETAEFLSHIFDTGSIKWELTLSDITAAVLMISAERKKQREKLKLELQKEDEQQQEAQQSNPTSSAAPGTRSRVLGNLMTVSFRKSNLHHVAHYQHVEKKLLDRGDDSDCAAIAAGGRFARFAHAVYGGSETLGQKLSCKQVPENDTVLGDSKHGANSKAFGKETREFVQPTDILYESWLQAEGDAHRIPYTIWIDHKWKAVCIAIRGTASLNDAVTDGAQQLDDLAKLKHKAEFAGIAGVGKVHSGFQRRALWLYGDLERVKRQYTGVKQAFGMCNQSGSDYRVVITGHSLGAAVATVVAYLLRPKYPDIRCKF